MFLLRGSGQAECGWLWHNYISNYGPEHGLTGKSGSNISNNEPSSVNSLFETTQMYMENRYERAMARSDDDKC